jgi:hypothetical protein
MYNLSKSLPDINNAQSPTINFKIDGMLIECCYMDNICMLECRYVRQLEYVPEDLSTGMCDRELDMHQSFSSALS